MGSVFSGKDRQRAIERDMSRYLSRRNTGRLKLPSLSSFFKRDAPVVLEEVTPELIQPVQEAPETQAEPVQESVLLPPKPGVVDRMRMYFAQPEPELVQQSTGADELRADMKELAKKTITLLHQVHPRYLQKVKDAPEMEEIKSIFRKHNIIK